MKKLETTLLPPPQTRRQQVERHLREMILNGHYAPGEKLIERELCEQMGVSRPSLREALRLLEAEKLIHIFPHRGPVVASISADEARDLYAMRALLESHAAQEFARLANPQQVEALSATVDRLHVTAAQGDRMALLATKTEFYNVLIEGCGNKLIGEVLLGLLSRVNLLRAASFSSPDRLPKSLQEIDDLMDAIREHDPERARLLAHAHILNAQRAALGKLDPSREFTDPPQQTQQGRELNESGTVRKRSANSP